MYKKISEKEDFRFFIGRPQKLVKTQLLVKKNLTSATSALNIMERL